METIKKEKAVSTPDAKVGKPNPHDLQFLNHIAHLNQVQLFFNFITDSFRQLDKRKNSLFSNARWL
jgi:hypothetical protein